MGERGERTEHTHDQAPANEAKATAGGPVDMVMALLSRAGADPDQLASIVQTFPHARDEVLAMLHQTLGNGFVRQVVARLAGTPAAHAQHTDAHHHHQHHHHHQQHHDHQDADEHHDQTVEPEQLREVVTQAAPHAKPPDHEPEHATAAATPHDDGIIGGEVHAKSAELHGAPAPAHDAKQDAWLHDNHDVTSVFPPELAALYEDCLAHAKAKTLVFPSKKPPPPGKTFAPFVRFIDAFYAHFHVHERRINVEIVKRGGKGAKAFYIQDYLESQLGAVLDANHAIKPGQRVHAKAHAAFVEMHEAAKRDGVDLKVVSGYRPPPRPDVPASDNPIAKATNSSHNYGLAIDFQLSVDKDHAADHHRFHVKEATTKDADNLLAYYGSSVAKWLLLNAARFDFHPYQMEPWHFEYNPKGMADEIIAGIQASKK